MRATIKHDPRYKKLVCSNIAEEPCPSKTKMMIVRSLPVRADCLRVMHGNAAIEYVITGYAADVIYVLPATAWSLLGHWRVVVKYGGKPVYSLAV